MGLANSSNAIYLTISNGKLCREVKTPSSTSKERVNKKGRTVHEEFYDHLTGTLKDIKVAENDYGKFWNVIITDEGVDYQLQFGYSSGYANGFLKALPNADLSKPLTFIPSEKMEGDKKRVALFMRQSGDVLKWYYTKETPNGIPELQKIKVKGKDTWDDTNVMEFLEAMVARDILPKLGHAAAPEAEESNADNIEWKMGKAPATTAAADADKLPF